MLYSILYCNSNFNLQTFVNDINKVSQFLISPGGSMLKHISSILKCNEDTPPITNCVIKLIMLFSSNKILALNIYKQVSI